MKLGQVLSTIDFDVIPESEREQFKERLSSLRDDAPQVPFKDIEKVLKKDLGGKVSDHFAEFDEEAIAAASIGQVYRATTHEGRDVAVKVQYPGVAEAVETDLRNIGVLLPLVKRLAPGLDVEGHRRRAARAHRRGARLRARGPAPAHRRPRAARPPGHPRPRGRHRDVHAARARHRVRLRARVRRDQGAARGRARPLRRDRLPLLLRAADPRAPGRRGPASGQLPARRRRARVLPGLRPHAVRAAGLPRRASGPSPARSSTGTPDAVHAGLAALGYLPAPDEFEPQRRPAAAAQRRRVVLHARFPAARPRVRPQRDRGRLITAVAVLRADAPADDSARRHCSSGAWRGCSSRSSANCVREPIGARWRSEYLSDAEPSTPMGERDAAHWNGVRA